jgi:hypothetical protein
VQQHFNFLQKKYIDYTTELQTKGGKLSLMQRQVPSTTSTMKSSYNASIFSICDPQTKLNVLSLLMFVNYFRQINIINVFIYFKNKIKSILHISFIIIILFNQINISNYNINASTLTSNSIIPTLVFIRRIG